MFGSTRDCCAIIKYLQKYFLIIKNKFKIESRSYLLEVENIFLKLQCIEESKLFQRRKKYQNVSENRIRIYRDSMLVKDARV